ncbi:MAG: hypothetical protein H6748_07515 [Spirochaetaceae bacterium]|nr:hypothetical protein [Spirochaetaceae bacterium]HPG24275.1 hypothetical protein [Myxococcota bacterium]
MDYRRFEADLFALLTANGWIASIEQNRQDTMIEWTPKGIECTRRFMDEVFALRPREQWNDAALDHLRSFGQYFGFVEVTRRDRLRKRLEPALRSRNILVVSITPQQRRSYRLFTARAFEGFYDYVEQQQDAGRQVVLIAAEDILESPVGRVFADGPTLWQRGP